MPDNIDQLTAEWRQGVMHRLDKLDERLLDLEKFQVRALAIVGTIQVGAVVAWQIVSKLIK